MAILKRYKRNLLLLLLLMAGAALLHPPAVSQAAEPVRLQEYKIKSGLLYNFLKYTQWPQDQSDGFLNVCLLGGDSFEGALTPLEGRTAQQRVIHIRSINDVASAEACSVVFVHKNYADKMTEILKNLQNRAVLSISDAPGFARRGGMVELATKQDQRIHILANRSAIARSGLNVDQRLLKLAETE